MAIGSHLDNIESVDGKMMKKIRSILRKHLELVVFIIQRKLGFVYWMHIGDVLTLCDGQMTGGQYFIASRALDIELIEKGLEPIWQNKLHDYFYEPMDEANADRANTRFKLLVNSINKRGLDPNVEPLSISDNPICLNNGTHRIAYMVLKSPNAYLPFKRIDKDIIPWFPVSGRTFWREKGMPEDELIMLEDRYKVMQENVRMALSGYVIESKWEEFKERCTEVGLIYKSQRIEIDGVTYIAFQWKLLKQKLFTDGKVIRSTYITKLDGLLKKEFGENYGVLAHTVTESIELDTYIENCIMQEINW